MTNCLNICSIAIIIIACLWSIIAPSFKTNFSNLHQSIVDWIIAEDLQRLSPFIIKSGCKSLEEIVNLRHLPDASSSDVEVFHHAKFSLKKSLIFKYFLTKNGFSDWIPRLKTVGVESLNNFGDDAWKKDLKEYGFYDLKFWEFHNHISRDKHSLEELSTDLWYEIAQKHGLSNRESWSIPRVAAYFVCIGVMTWLSWLYYLMMQQGGKMKGFFHILMGRYLYTQWCSINCLWTDPAVVGTTVSFVIKFFQVNRKPYPISDADGLVIEITQGMLKVGVLSEVGGTTEEEVNTARCKFTPRKAGEYKISAKIGNKHIPGSPFIKKFVAGPPDASKIAIVHHSSTIITSANVPHFLLVEPRDLYQNICSFSNDSADIDNYNIVINHADNDNAVDSIVSMSYDKVSLRITIKVILPMPGCYIAKISYCGSLLINGSFDVIALTKEDSIRVQKTVLKRSHEGFEARLISQNDTSLSTSKKVYCFVTPKQLFIQEYFLKLFPMRVCTFRLCPATKFQFINTNNSTGFPELHISDGCQPPVCIASKDREIIAATFTQFMLKNIGGSETFRDKQDHFYHEVRRHHLKRPHDRIGLTVNRYDLLRSSLKATKSFSLVDWCKNFEITFQGEEGLDWGGIRREWFELICFALFDPSSKLFKSFHEGSQALVHPNPDRPKELKLKLYEFAGRIVGKCLYESALGTNYRLMVRARFTRSFLAQLIGLRVHYKHFAYDDPDLYNCKIMLLLENGIRGLDEPLYFTDEILLPNGHLKTVELKPNGHYYQVTDDNKLQYLDALSQFRLATNVKQEIEAFLSGLNDIIPENLLCIFDENELELLMCGIEIYSITDFKENHVSCSTSPEFRRVLTWFWIAVTNFSEEEMARLLQFTTGCSRLPPGGFKHLSPPFQIAPSHTFGNLPTAHTCFNQLCLPDYDCYENFLKALLFAIKEGSEGFGMA